MSEWYKLYFEYREFTFWHMIMYGMFMSSVGEGGIYPGALNGLLFVGLMVLTKSAICKIVRLFR